MSNATELLSLANLKAYLQITSESYDTILASIKAGVEAWIKTHCRDPFLVAARTEYYDGNGLSIMRVRHYPITAISEINIDSNRVFGTSTKVDTGDMIQTDQSNAQGIVELFNLFFPEGQKNVKITYSAGYATIPADLAHAVKILCAREFMVQDKQLTGQTMQSVGDKNITLSLEEIPRNAWDILSSYKRPLI